MTAAMPPGSTERHRELGIEPAPAGPPTRGVWEERLRAAMDCPGVWLRTTEKVGTSASAIMDAANRVDWGVGPLGRFEARTRGGYPEWRYVPPREPCD